MFCPNCGANNNKKQNYCRFCGLNLRDTAKSLTSQLVFGEDTDRLKSLSSARRLMDSASTALAGALIICVVAYLFIEPTFSKNVVKIFLGIFFLLKLIQETIGYYLRRGRSKATADKFAQSRTEQLETKETVRFLEEKPLEPVLSVAENSTELLPLGNKTRKLD